MKMIIAVTFLGILMHVFAKDCQLKPAVANFKYDEYSKVRHFYVTHSKFEPKENVCEEFNFIQFQSENVKTIVTEVYKTGGKEVRLIYQCTDKPKNGKPGQFSIECDVWGKGTVRKVNLETSIIATDYKNYIFLHTCFSYGKEEMLVMQKENEGDGKSVKDAAARLGLSLDSWFSRKNVNCDDIKK
uniref:Pc12, similar to pallidipin n=1 Tax=Panstrongylus chinai TaxID=156444 RepID=A0A286T600_9HEMI|nr:Pc12, similar to pallidipin [Panstrongylus chinai]